MSRDGLLPEGLGRVHPRYRSPAAALVLQGVWSSLLVLFLRGFSQLFTYVIVGGWLIYGLAVGSVFVLRWREPRLERPFRVPGYPVTPAVFVAAALGLMISTILQRPRESLLGLGFIALGVPFYYLFRRTPAGREKSDRL
jgi:APA family basic amino acid/polyamine antiporter